MCVTIALAMVYEKCCSDKIGSWCVARRLTVIGLGRRKGGCGSKSIQTVVFLGYHKRKSGTSGTIHSLDSTHLLDSNRALGYAAQLVQICITHAATSPCTSRAGCTVQHDRTVPSERQCIDGAWILRKNLAYLRTHLRTLITPCFLLTNR